MDFPSDDPQITYKRAAVRTVEKAYGVNTQENEVSVESRYMRVKGELFQLSQDYIEGPNFPEQSEGQEGAYRAVVQVCTGFITTAYDYENRFIEPTIVYDELKSFAEDLMPHKKELAQRLVDELCPQEFQHKVYSPMDKPYDDGFSEFDIH